MAVDLAPIDESLLAGIANMHGMPKGAFNIRKDGQLVERHSSAYIDIETKTDNPGINIYISAKAQGETVYIPACVTKSGVNDLVYNDFFIEPGADVIIVAGCGVHTEGEEESRHNGVHRFFLGKGARALYKEKHIGTGSGTGARRIDPVTDMTLEEDAYFDMDTLQIGGVTSTNRTTNGRLGARAKLVIRERLLTAGDEIAASSFNVSLDGDDSGVDLASRSAARCMSYQEPRSVTKGTCRCTGHSERDAIPVDHGRVTAQHALSDGLLDASLLHDAPHAQVAG